MTTQSKFHLIDSAKATVARLHDLLPLAHWAWIPGSADWTEEAHSDFAEAYNLIESRLPYADLER